MNPLKTDKRENKLSFGLIQGQNIQEENRKYVNISESGIAELEAFVQTRYRLNF